MSWNMMRSQNTARFNASHSVGSVFSHSSGSCSLFPSLLSTFFSFIIILFSLWCAAVCKNHFSVEFSLPQGLWLVQLLNVLSLQRLLTMNGVTSCKWFWGGKKIPASLWDTRTQAGFWFFGQLGNRARDSWRDCQYVYTAFSLKYICNHLGNWNIFPIKEKLDLCVKRTLHGSTWLFLVRYFVRVYMGLSYSIGFIPALLRHTERLGGKLCSHLSLFNAQNIGLLLVGWGMRDLITLTKMWLLLFSSGFPWGRALCFVLWDRGKYMQINVWVRRQSNSMKQTHNNVSQNKLIVYNNVTLASAITQS